MITPPIFILILIYISLGASLNLLMGYAGQFSMAQAVFYGIGAYSAGLLAVNLGFSPVVSIIGAIVISFISAGILALPAAKRVSGEYLILLTLAFQIVVNQLMNSMRDLTGGPYGFTVPWLTILGRDFITPVEYVPPLMVIGCLIVLLVTWGIGESRLVGCSRGFARMRRRSAPWARTPRSPRCSSLALPPA